MSESKHTPAPWNVFYVRKYDEWHVSLPCSSPGSDIGIFPDGVQSENPEADARLIAAAPELLRAVILFLGEEDDDDVRFAFEQDKINFARAAIAKARGEK